MKAGQDLASCPCWLKEDSGSVCRELGLTLGVLERCPEFT